MNSTLMGKIFRMRVPLKGDVFPEFRVFDLNQQIPIKICDKKKQENIVDLVNKILAGGTRTEIEKLESKIDHLIYHLYDLTYDEVLIIDPETPITREEYENFKCE